MSPQRLVVRLQPVEIEQLLLQRGIGVSPDDLAALVDLVASLREQALSLMPALGGASPERY